MTSPYFAQLASTLFIPLFTPQSRGFKCSKRKATQTGCPSPPGVLNLPALALGVLLGGLVMKRYKLSLVSGAQLYLATSFTAYLLTLLYFSTKCDNVPVAGLTVSYQG